MKNVKYSFKEILTVFRLKLLPEFVLFCQISLIMRTIGVFEFIFTFFFNQGKHGHSHGGDGGHSNGHTSNNTGDDEKSPLSSPGLDQHDEQKAIVYEKNNDQIALQLNGGTSQSSNLNNGTAVDEKDGHGHGHKKINSCLLYTSPSPRDRG